jgi:hypothetical protein
MDSTKDIDCIQGGDTTFAKLQLSGLIEKVLFKINFDHSISKECPPDLKICISPVNREPSETHC